MRGVGVLIVSPIYSGVRADIVWAMGVPPCMAAMIDAVEFCFVEESDDAMDW